MLEIDRIISVLALAEIHTVGSIIPDEGGGGKFFIPISVVKAVCVKPVVAPFFQPVIKSGPQGAGAAATAALTTLSRSGLSVTAP